MKYLWTEDTGAGLHFWGFVNEILFGDECVVESKKSNQGLLDAVRKLQPLETDVYYIAFDKVYDNQDIRDKYLELKKKAANYPRQIILLDTICFEYMILCFEQLVTWTGTGKQDKIEIRYDILQAIDKHRIDLSRIRHQKTLEYLMGFKHYSTERVIKSLVNELTENDMWSVKGKLMGECWYQDCCIVRNLKKRRCNIDGIHSGKERISKLLHSEEIQRVIHIMK